MFSVAREPAREPPPSRAEPDFLARKNSEPSRAQLGSARFQPYFQADVRFLSGYPDEIGLIDLSYQSDRLVLRRCKVRHCSPLVPVRLCVGQPTMRTATESIMSKETSPFCDRSQKNANVCSRRDLAGEEEISQRPSSSGSDGYPSMA